ncbi:hypothetical protein FB45DRAFT_37553 [Roridomyces roridus]|uniref:Uncharacterized protein n=1 Tax=Roridomyces roridus TaxID=1738132 RepID=A0AAD7BRE8_9AGAR|nr:hypothetical protein FB45DRAFT_37553 [Roridomyces roridus]
MDPHIADILGHRWLGSKVLNRLKSSQDIRAHCSSSRTDDPMRPLDRRASPIPIGPHSLVDMPHLQTRLILKKHLGQDISSSRPACCAANVLLALPPYTGECLLDTCYTMARIDVLSRRCHPIWVNAAWSTRMLRDDAISETKIMRHPIGGTRSGSSLSADGGRRKDSSLRRQMFLKNIIRVKYTPYVVVV